MFGTGAVKGNFDLVAGEIIVAEPITSSQVVATAAANSFATGNPKRDKRVKLSRPPTLARTLRSTNAVESIISICRDHARNVKRWRDGQMALRWCAAGIVEAYAQFRRVNGHLHLPALRTARNGTSPPRLSAPTATLKT